MSIIAATTWSKEVWDILEMKYNERESKINYHQAIVIEEVVNFDIE